MHIRHLPFFQQVGQRLATISPTKTEESILLRLLVQALVVVGILATDIAAQTKIGVWAIPLSIVAAVWSWYSRRKRNLTAKFLIAIAMVLAMAAFFGNLLTNLHDTRLVLAELLIQLQVLHSFDLPRRKDLGYSMVIGLILLGVAATLSQTLSFGFWLCLFLVIALPVLILDYRSRLGLVEKQLSRWQHNPSPSKRLSVNIPSLPFSLQRLSGLLLIILALGLIIFALLPRIPSSTQFSFPVNSPVSLDNEGFTPERTGIFNPEVEGDNFSEGSFQNNQDQQDSIGTEAFYYGFQTKIDQGKVQTAQLEPKTVMRVRSQAPGFWRVLAFDRYTGRGWELSRSEELTTLKRPNWNYRFFVPIRRFGAKTKQVIQTYSILAPLPNLIPALTYPKEIYFPTAEVAVDLESSLRSPLPLADGLTYTVVSQVPLRDRTVLRDTPQDYTAIIKKYYLPIPAEIATPVKQRTEELLATSPKPLISPYEKALFLAQALKQRYTLLEETPVLAEDEDLVSAFLFENQGGYRDQFSTVLTVMLRSIGIPARLVTGFDTGSFNPLTGFYLVQNTDAYALTEVFFPNHGWFTFDPIPGHELIPQSVEEVRAFGFWKQFWSWAAGWLPSPVTSLVGVLWRVLLTGSAAFISWLWELVSSGWLGAVTGISLLGSLVWLMWLSGQKLFSWRDRLGLAKLPPMERLYRQMLRTLAARGYKKQPYQTPLEYAHYSRQQHHTATADIVEEVSRAYVAWRYGKRSPNISYLRQQLKLLKPRKGN